MQYFSIAFPVIIGKPHAWATLLPKVSSNPPVFSSGVTANYLEDNTSMDGKAKSSLSSTIAESSSERALTIAGNLNASFDVAQVVKLSGSANVDFSKSNTCSNVIRTFNSWETGKT